jgi:hypothetical protein
MDRRYAIKMSGADLSIRDRVDSKELFQGSSCEPLRRSPGGVQIMSPRAIKARARIGRGDVEKGLGAEHLP